MSVSSACYQHCDCGEALSTNSGTIIAIKQQWPNFGKSTTLFLLAYPNSDQPGRATRQQLQKIMLPVLAGSCPPDEDPFVCFMGCGSSKSSSAAAAVGKGAVSPSTTATAATSSSSPRGAVPGTSDPSIQPPRPPPWDHDASSVHSTHSDATNGHIGGCASGDGSESSLPSVMSAPDLQQLKNRNGGHHKTGSKLGLTDDLKCGERKNPNLVRIEVPLGKGIEEVYQGVHDGTVLGSGVSGIVRRVTHRETSVEYAVKCLDLALIDSDAGLRQLKEEIYIMCQLVSASFFLLSLVGCKYVRVGGGRVNERSYIR